MKLRLTRKKCVNKKKCTKKKCTNKNRVTRKHHTHGGVKLLNRIKGLTMNNKLTMQKLEMYITYQTYATFEYDTINNVYNSIVQSLLINMKKNPKSYLRMIDSCIQNTDPKNSSLSNNSSNTLSLSSNTLSNTLSLLSNTLSLLSNTSSNNSSNTLSLSSTTSSNNSSNTLSLSSTTSSNISSNISSNNSSNTSLQIIESYDKLMRNILKTSDKICTKLTYEKLFTIFCLIGHLYLTINKKYTEYNKLIEKIYKLIDFKYINKTYGNSSKKYIITILNLYITYKNKNTKHDHIIFEKYLEYMKKNPLLYIVMIHNMVKKNTQLPSILLEFPTIIQSDIEQGIEKNIKNRLSNKNDIILEEETTSQETLSQETLGVILQLFYDLTTTYTKKLSQIPNEYKEHNDVKKILELYFNIIKTTAKDIITLMNISS